MNTKRSSKRSLRRLFALGVAGVVTVSGLTALGLPASAHDGVDHGSENGADSALDWTNYEKVLLTKNVGEPIDLAVLPDKKVLHTARNGEIRLTDPATGTTNVVAQVPVYANSEDGLQSIGIDPDFAENNWVYLVYAPQSGTPTGSAPNTVPAGADPATYWDQWKGVNRLSRFQWTGSTIDLASEQKIIDVEVQRGQCCHVGADFDWDDEGNLYLGTGDNTPASAPGAAGFAPNNDAPGMNPGFDSRRGAGNTNDLRGKILRIHVEENGSYTIPEGNLFPVGTEKTRPEIFVMGVRNPFKLEVDPETNMLSWGDYGPDATRAAAATAGRGPMGLVEWNATSLDTPQNSGWPYVTGDNFAYNEWNFETATPGAFFDPAALKNNSRWNTGLVDIPAPTPATLYYGDSPGDQPWDELVNFGTGSGQGPMGGPVYHYDAANPSTSKFPEYWNNKSFMGEFSQDYIAAFTLDDDLEVTHIEDFLPNSALTQAAQPIHDNPMDMEFGPDGSLYVIEYGDGFFRANPDAGLYRIDFAAGNKAPQARFSATPISGSEAPLTVAFDATASTDPEDSALNYEWDFDGNGSFDATGVTASHTYTELGQFTARLRVTDAGGKFSLSSRVISVGNTAPVVTVDYPQNGAFFQWGQAVPYKVSAVDAEDGNEIVSSRVSWTYGLGHDEHAHPEVAGTGATGAWRTSADSPEHGIGAFLYGAVVVNYTDAGHNGLPPATGEATVQLNPFLQEAENALGKYGVEVFDDATASGGKAISGLGAGEALRYDPVSLQNITGVVLRASGAGTVEFRWGAVDAAPFATTTVPGGAGWQNVTVPFTNAPAGSGQLFVTSASELSVDSLTFQGAGAGDVTAPVVTAALEPAAPTGVGGVYNVPVTLALAPSDNGALASVQYSVNNGTTWTNVTAASGYRVPFTTNGARTVLYRATDTGGNVSNVGTVSFTIDLTAPNAPTVDTTTTLVIPSPRVTYGAPGSVTVTVAGQGGTPTGEVAILSNGMEIARGTLASGSATVILPPNVAVGTHSGTAQYLGDTTFKPSTSAAGRLIVSKAASVLTTSVGPNPVKPNVQAQVSIGAVTETGVAGTGQVTVQVKRNLSTVALLTGTLDEAGNVVVTLPKLAAGGYKLTVTHTATANTTAASSLLNLTVQP